MNDIGILSLTRFGDLVQTSPVTSALRRLHPGARIHLIVKSRFRAVAEMLPGVDVVHEIDGDALACLLTQPGTPFSECYETLLQLVERLRCVSFDWLCNLTHSRASAVLLSLLDAPRTTGFTLDRAGHRRVDEAWLTHMGTLVRARRLMRLNLVDSYLGATGALGQGERLSVRIPAEARARAAELLPDGRRFVAVQLGASQDAKTWSVERYARTITEIAQRRPDLEFALVGVAAEQARGSRLEQLCPSQPLLSLIGKTSIVELGAVLSRCELLLTGDTGTMHLAAAVGTRTCAIFVGLGSPYETAAYGEGHVALVSRLACAPCSHLVRCGRPICHEDMPPEWVARLVCAILEGSPIAALEMLPRADVLITRFDENGLLELSPAHRRRPESHDLLALAYHAIYLEGLGGIEIDADSVRRRAQDRFGVAPSAWQDHLPAELEAELASLSALAREGLGGAARLSEAFACDLCDNARPEAVALARRIGDTLAGIDAEIYRLGRSSPLIKPLCLSLEGESESLPEADVYTTAHAAALSYASLAHRADALRAFVVGEPLPEGSRPRRGPLTASTTGPQGRASRPNAGSSGRAA